MQEKQNITWQKITSAGFEYIAGNVVLLSIRSPPIMYYQCAQILRWNSTSDETHICTISCQDEQIQNKDIYNRCSAYFYVSFNGVKRQGQASS